MKYYEWSNLQARPNGVISVNEAQGPDDQATSKDERRRQAMQATEHAAKSGRELHGADIDVVNITTRLEQSRKVRLAAEAIWFDADPSDHFSDRDPTDPWHGGVGHPLDPVDVVYPS